MALLFSSGSLWAQTPKQTELRERVAAVMDRLDAMPKEKTRSFIYSVYQQVLESDPTDLETFTIELLLNGVGMEEPLDRSHFVEQLLVLRTEKDFLSWEDIENNIDLLEELDPQRAPIIGVYDFRIKEDFETSEKKYLEPITHNGEYQAYFGFLHAHSELSDGRGDARQAYQMAKHEAGLDYFALTDHSELLHFWPWDRKYKQLKRVSNEFNEDGRFTALYGFEWSHPLLGHFNVVNTESYTSAILRPTMGLLMNWLSRKSGAFGRFNHPGRVNRNYWPYEFSKLKVYNQALRNVVGIEMWNKNDSLRDYLYERGSFKEGFNFLDNANLNGWFVGAVGGQDNHDADWGLRNDYRVGVWSEGLSREQIVESYFARRTFATEDKNAWVSFRFGDAQMGSRLIPGTYNVTIEFGDGDGEKAVRVDMVRKGQVIDSRNVGEDQVIVDQMDGEVGDYFYVVVEQEDGDLLLSSPIWIVPQPR